MSDRREVDCQGELISMHRESLFRRPSVFSLRSSALLLAMMALSLFAASARSADLGPQELFELGGIGQDELAQLATVDSWQASDRDVLRRMLYRIEQDVRPADWEEWSLGDMDWRRIAAEPDAYQLEVFRLRGRVLLVEPYPLSSREDDPAEFASIWRCRMKLDSAEQTIDVFSPRCPKAWKVGQPIDEPSGALALMLKVRLGESSPIAWFLTDHIAWYPPTYLGRLGMDVGLLDDVVVEPPPKKGPDGATPEVDWSTRRFTQRDHEPFYQMLNAVGDAKPGQLQQWAREELAQTGKSSFSVIPLFNHPQTEQGRLVELRGVARRIVPVRIGEPEVRERFGIDEYYQVYLFTEDSQNNPIVFCLRQVPEGLPMGDGPGFGEELSIPGFFYKTWSYPVSEVVSDGKPQRQLAPLLIGNSAVWFPDKPPARLSPTARLIGTTALLAVLGVVWWVFRQFGRGDRESARRRRAATGPADMDWQALDSSADET